MGLCRLLLIFLFSTSWAFAESEKEKIFSLLASATKVSNAKIRRGNITIPIDLAHASTKDVVQDYDVIMLEEGVYNTIGNFTAKYVRVRGQGQRKTFISSMPQGSTPIMVNSTEFWDLTIADAQFKISDLSGLWAVKVEFAGSILIQPSDLTKSPAFAVRSVFSDLTNSDLPSVESNLYANFLSKHGEKYLMPLPGNETELFEKRTATVANFLAYEDRFDKAKDLHLKNRVGYKGLFARGLNYLYQKEELKPQYDHAKYIQLTKNARSSRKEGHIYVAMLYWAEADRLSGHSKFDEVLKEITPLNQNLSQECGCTVEGQGLASATKLEIEQKLYTKLPITGLPGRCKIQTLQVVVPPGGNKAALISAARQQAKSEHEMLFKTSEDKFQKTMLAHSGKNFSGPEEEFLLGAEAPASPIDYTAVADVEMPGVKKSYTSDVKDGKNVNRPVDQSILDLFAQKFAAKLKAAKTKIASSVLVAKIDGLITLALYGDDPARQQAYDDLHEQQFGRKLSAQSAMSSVFAY